MNDKGSDQDTVNGLLLINVGTPDAPTPKAVRRYLREFLSDPRVIDINPFLRMLLLNFVILPLRPRRSAAAYQKVWNDRGSPLLRYSLELVDAVQTRLGSGWRVRLGMRYGNPSIRAALDDLSRKGVDRLVVMPLYPQQAMSSVGSGLHAVYAALAEAPSPLPISVVEPFFDDPRFLDAMATLGRPIVERERPDHVLFSFHGLPERQIRKADPSGQHCLVRTDCCARVGPENRGCYRAQCFATARLLAERLALPTDRYTVCFQSRLGRTPWILPHTDMLLPELVKKEQRRIVVFCPAFVTDCLETLEEIGIRAREDFLKLGGESLMLVPGLNADARWADALVALVQRQIERFAPR